ncbi:uncharacterized protein LOC131660922 isoform X1 [Vicia villosa]|uniref:uncharacterized protein LOC131660922 isoform X1 n=1 Tax=Vicia villosa TaxID=3911 RepID=UPI00273ACD03|nr:uncharacterized protein LOC131660922 isoform X1 [Vicia villosa]XP_058786263.1 uncharacterized protein LOC131660922 isoform X1 [Vicia villosa]
MEDGSNQVAEDYSVAFGDMIYVKLPRSGFWWPAQVVDDGAVVSSLKPRSCRKGEVLVRVYGSHLFLNVDPVKSCYEFETILKNNNGDLQKILGEGLEKSLPSSKRPASKAKAGTPSKKASSSKKQSNKKGEEQTKVKRQKQNESKEDDLGSPSCETATGKLQELSSRRIRVMQSLGLSAPTGSPFIKVRGN